VSRRQPKQLVMSNFARVAIAHLVNAANTTPEGVLVPGLGVFWVASRRARTVRHPVTKELMTLPETRELRFRAVKAAREVLKEEAR
jgi:nucleoid DNA-binding protein